MVNNKTIGSSFEKEVCLRLAKKGFWAHFIVPDPRGAQPFDIIAVKNGKAVAIDCKTCVAETFNMNRLEMNQIMAFEHWLKCGNSEPVIVVKHNDHILCVEYTELKNKGKCRLEGKYEETNFSIGFDDYFNRLSE